MDKLLNTPITCDIELGTNTPCHSLSNVIVQGNDNSELIYIDGAFDGGSPIYLGLTKSRGNKQNKLPVEAGDVLGGFQVYGRIKAGNSVGYDHLETPLCGSVMFKVGNEYKFGDKSIPTELMIVVGNEKSLEIKNKCLFCEHNFLNKSNLKKHIYNVCPEKKLLEQTIQNIEDDKIKFIEENKKISEEKLKDEEIKSLREMVMKLMNKHSDNVVNNTNNGVINNNNGVVNNNLILNINPFGKEDLSHITIEDYKKYLNGFFPGFIELVEKILFNYP